MSVIEEVLYNRLSTNAGLQALLGTSPTRVYAVRLPQDVVVPSLTYQPIGRQRSSAMGSDTGLAHARFQLSSWSAKFGEAVLVKEAARAAVQRWKGTSLGIVVQDIFLEEEREDFDTVTLMHNVMLDILIHFLEA